MITLHGFPFSNYYNIVKHTLMLKGIDFREDLRYGDDPDWLSISPVGKIPAMTTAQGQHLSESSVCCDYLEETYPEKPLYPADSIGRAQVRQMMRVSELYLELPCRRLIPFVFAKKAVPAELEVEVRSVVSRGVGALNRIGSFDPYIAGAKLTRADISLRYVMSVVALAKAGVDWDVAAEIQGLKEWQTLMAASDTSRKVDADREANQDEFFAAIRNRMGG